MNKFLTGALVSNAATMGYNWIYNMPYLERLAKTETLTFQKADPAKYKRARKAVLAYPNAEVGDVSLQGEIAKWLYDFMKDSPKATKEDYADLIYNHIQPGGDYSGWVESYGKALVYNRLSDDLKTDHSELKIEDDQLVGFIPYLVFKELGFTVERSYEFAQIFTSNDDYLAFYKVFDCVFDNLMTMSMKEALQKAIPLAPQQFGFKLTMAVQMEDTTSFVQQLSNTSCAIQYALPLIFNILANTDSFEEAVSLNTKLGGASADRGMLIGAIYAQVSKIPEDWISKTNLK